MPVFQWGFLIWNGIVFLLYGADKLFARKHIRRISEACLLSIGFLMGAMGAMFGMIVWNHKTQKLKFRILVPLFVLCNFFLIWVAPYLIYPEKNKQKDSIFY